MHVLRVRRELDGDGTEQATHAALAVNSASLDGTRVPSSPSSWAGIAQASHGYRIAAASVRLQHCHSASTSHSMRQLGQAAGGSAIGSRNVATAASMPALACSNGSFSCVGGSLSDLITQRHADCGTRQRALIRRKHRKRRMVGGIAS